MSNLIPELQQEYRLVEQQVRAKYKDVFDQIEQELLEKYSKVWAEQGFDTSKLRLEVNPQVRLYLDDPDPTVEEQ